MNTNELREAFGDFQCDRMLRAWRNRTPVTQWRWRAVATKLGLTDYASLLYVACGHYTWKGTFSSQHMSEETWQDIAWRILWDSTANNKPLKALSREEYYQ